MERGGATERKGTHWGIEGKSMGREREREREIIKQ